MANIHNWSAHWGKRNNTYWQSLQGRKSESIICLPGN
jgi:hypothetical protein